MTIDGMPIKYELLPKQFRGGAERWIEHGIRPGGFLRAVLDNQLMEALARKDDSIAIEDVRGICRWLHNQAPPTSFGSPEQTAAWHEARRSETA